MNTFTRLVEASGGKTPMELSTTLNESPQTLTNWAKRGVSKAGAIKASKIFGVRIDWLLTGDGRMKEQLQHGLLSNESSPPMKNDDLTITIPFFDTEFSMGAGFFSPVEN